MGPAGVSPPLEPSFNRRSATYTTCSYSHVYMGPGNAYCNLLYFNLAAHARYGQTEGQLIASSRVTNSSTASYLP